MRPGLTDSEYRRFSDWLREEYGLTFGPEKRDILRSRLEPMRVELSFETFEQLFLHLKFHPERRGDREKLIPHLTNNESYFFRESPQLELLKDEVLRSVAERVQARKRHEIRILSAGCAAGEEPYTIAMLLRDFRGLPPGMRLRITGIDLDPEALRRAREGSYTENAFRRIEKPVRDRFFTLNGDGRWKIAEDLRQMVRFERANLAASDWPGRLPKQDVIFCRNVLIYFDERGMQTAVESFYSALDPGGCLFLGHAESLSRVPTKFVAVRRPGAIYYQKPDADHG